MSSVFISHSHKDSDLAEDLYHALERAGYEAYLDKKALEVGKEYNVAIQSQVAKSDFFVFLISPESTERGAYSLTELDYAAEKWLKQPEGVIPVMVRPVEAKALPAFLRQITYLSPTGNATAEVVAELNRRSQAAAREDGQGRADRSVRAKQYFDDELNHRSEKYEQSSAAAAFRNRLLQTIVVVCALGVSVLSFGGVESSSSLGLVLTVLGLMTPLLILLNALGNYQAKSFRYRLAAERMNRERRKYVNVTVPYTVGLGENRAYELFVENIEQILQDEQMA